MSALGLRAMPQAYREAMVSARRNAYLARYAMPARYRPDFAWLARHSFAHARRLRLMLDDPFFAPVFQRGEI